MSWLGQLEATLSSAPAPARALTLTHKAGNPHTLQQSGDGAPLRIDESCRDGAARAPPTTAAPAGRSARLRCTRTQVVGGE